MSRGFFHPGWEVVAPAWPSDHASASLEPWLSYNLCCHGWEVLSWHCWRQMHACPGPDWFTWSSRTFIYWFSNLFFFFNGDLLRSRRHQVISQGEDMRKISWKAFHKNIFLFILNRRGIFSCFTLWLQKRQFHLLKTIHVQVNKMITPSSHHCAVSFKFALCIRRHTYIVMKCVQLFVFRVSLS